MYAIMFYESRNTYNIYSYVETKLDARGRSTPHVENRSSRSGNAMDLPQEDTSTLIFHRKILQRNAGVGDNHATNRSE